MNLRHSQRSAYYSRQTQQTLEPSVHQPPQIRFRVLQQPLFVLQMRLPVVFERAHSTLNFRVLLQELEGGRNRPSA